MFKNVKPILQTLFTNGATVRRAVDFEWWLIRRKGQPFLLLPTTAAEAHVALELYSAQRLHAKIMRALLPLLLKTPASLMFERIRIRADASSEMLQFMSQQSGVPVDCLRAPAIKVGGLAIHKARLVMLLCDEAGRPVKVAKVGVNPETWEGLHPDGWEATNLEANQLERLPSDIIGCIRMTGRCTSPALTVFATTYFSGDSPRDDIGMENLFHSWMNPHAPVPVESLDSWRELEAKFSRVDPLAWQILKQSVSQKKIHSTIQHGDFAPWNIRATGAQNLQVFDWERSQLHGIPGWDWFHFSVQTSILVKRYNEKRVAAEVEHLFQSPRFQVYASAARITDIVKPLFLAYLLHQKWVIKPIEGGATTEKLYELLAARWRLKPFAPALVAVDKIVKPSLFTAARGQLQFAVSQLLNLVWEPSLSPVAQPSMLAQFSTHWKMIMASILFFAGLVGTQFNLNAYTHLHLNFLLFYLIPCLWLTLKLDRRWGAIAGTAAAVASPLLLHLQNPTLLPLQVTLWNLVMRFILIQIIVTLADHIRGQNILSLIQPPKKISHSLKKFADYWAVILASCLFLVGVILLDLFTSPLLNLMPLYLLPCMVMTLTIDRRWGTAASLIAAVAAPFTQRYEDVYHRHILIELWNTFVYFMLFQVVVLLLDYFRRENVRFFPVKTEDDLNAAGEFSVN